MPRLIEASTDEITSLDECAHAILEDGFDPQCEERLHHAALWLRRLANNRTFLGDMLIDNLKSQHAQEAKSGYGPQAIILSPLRNDTFLRANIWPSPSDNCFLSSGAKTFVYGIAHDHNFSFLTAGYFGPGYKSDYYEYDYATTTGFAGEKPDLRFVERSALSEGKMLLYRAHRDIHSQIPPDALSVSLNVMHVNPVQNWFDQYGFDLDKGEITQILSRNIADIFLRVAVASGSEEALDLAENFGRSHPCDRMRVASYEARASLLATGAKADEERDALWREAELSGNRLLAETAKVNRDQIAAAMELAS